MRTELPIEDQKKIVLDGNNVPEGQPLQIDRETFLTAKIHCMNKADHKVWWEPSRGPGQHPRLIVCGVWVVSKDQ